MYVNPQIVILYIHYFLFVGESVVILEKCSSFHLENSMCKFSVIVNFYKVCIQLYVHVNVQYTMYAGGVH